MVKTKRAILINKKKKKFWGYALSYSACDIRNCFHIFLNVTSVVALQMLEGISFQIIGPLQNKENLLLFYMLDQDSINMMLDNWLKSIDQSIKYSFIAEKISLMTHIGGIYNKSDANVRVKLITSMKQVI